MKAMLTLVAAVLLGGCISSVRTDMIQRQDANGVAERCKLTRDDFKKLRHLESPDIAFTTSENGSYQYWLSATLTDDGEAYLRLHLRTIRRDWFFWRDAADSNGTRFPLTRDGTDVGRGGITLEQYSTRLSRDYLETVRDGIDWRFYGERGSITAPIPSNLIQGFLARVDSEIAP